MKLRRLTKPPTIKPAAISFKSSGTSLIPITIEKRSCMALIRQIDIQFIPEAQMRQPGIGDWWFEGDILHVRAVEGDLDGPFLVALHELVEAWLCKAHGVDQLAVDDFDNLFETEPHPDEAEPGDDPRAPYRTEHRQAMLIEHLMANFLGISDYGTIR